MEAELKLYCVSLGCPKNTVDTEVMLGLLRREGAVLVPKAEEADVLLVNTCTFIAPATRESFKAIRELAAVRRGKKKFLIVAGCLAQRQAGALMEQYPEIDAVVGTGEVGKIGGILRALQRGERPVRVGRPGFLSGPGTGTRLQITAPWTAYLKISEGCDHACSFCIIPSLRGRMRSRPLAALLREARGLAARGVRELNVIGQDTSLYGRDLYGRPRLAELLRGLARIPELEWVRLLYLHPGQVSEDLLRTMAEEPKLCKYIDLPLQHVHPAMLKAMRRPGSPEKIHKLLSRIRQALPGAAVRTVLITGFPGETRTMSAAMERFVREARFDRVGVFAYSPEAGTPAALLPGQVPVRERARRRDVLMRLQQGISLEKNRDKIGSVLRVLLVQPPSRDSGGMWVARSEQDAPEIDGRVYVAVPKAYNDLQAGNFLTVRITGAAAYDLTAVPEGAP